MSASGSSNDLPFRSLAEFVRRTGLSQAVLVRLARADAFGSLGLDRRTALWEVLNQKGASRPAPPGKTGDKKRSRQLELFSEEEPAEPRADLPPLSLPEQVLADYRTVSLSLRAHPVSLIRPELDRRRVTPAGRLKEIAHGRYLRVAGVVLVRQRPGTARGITFFTLEDETGTANLIVRPEIMDRYRKPARTAAAIIAHGSLEKHGEVIHVMVNRLEDISDLVRQLPSQSRDFR